MSHSPIRMARTLLITTVLAAGVSACSAANSPVPPASATVAPSPSWTPVDDEVEDIIRDAARAVATELTSFTDETTFAELGDHWRAVGELATESRDRLLALSPTCTKLAHGHYLEAARQAQDIADVLVPWVVAGADPETEPKAFGVLGDPYPGAVERIGLYQTLALEALDGCHP